MYLYLVMTLEILTSEALSPCVIILSSMGPKYSRFLYYTCSYLFFLCFPPSFFCPLSFIFLLWYTSCSMRNKALDQKYSNLCAYTRSRACLLSMKSGSDASWLSATLCQPRRESWHLAQGPSHTEGLPKPMSGCQLLSSDWQSRLSLRWSSPPSPCQGDRWNERNRNQ